MGKIIALVLLVCAVSPARAANQNSKPERGTATVYAQMLVGRSTSSGQPLDRYHRTAAHRTLPFGTLVEVTNRKNGRKAIVRINDRGPYRRHTVIDLSPAAAAALGMGRRSIAPVELRIVELRIAKER
jgi:rare lipoprotein A